jgi:ABC-2 type transport system permease protein
MHAEPLRIDYQEGYSLMNPKPDGLDLPYHIMAHEVAHQWWGMYLAPAAVEGAGLLIESLATYSAMQVVEETLGREYLLRYLSQMRQEYEVPRSKAAPPLLRSNHSFLNYRKGPFALYALRHYIGKKRVNDALRQLLRTYTPAPPLPTTLDFYRELLAVTPDSLHYLLHDLFATNTFWDLKTEQATAKQTKTGDWLATLTIDARKMRVDSMGRETNAPMNDWIEIGISAPAEKGQKTGLPIYLQKHRIRSGKQRIAVMVPGKLIKAGPIQAGIDPNYLLIDYEMNDNRKALTFER